MSNSDIQSRFGFLIVNDREELRRLLGKFLEVQFKMSEENILKTEGLGLEEIDVLLKEIYDKGLYPVVLLDEYLGTDTISGTKVFEHIVKEHPEGGLAVGCSSMGTRDQCRLWKSTIGARKTKWEVEPLNDFSLEGIEELRKPMETFLENQREETDSEIGNII